MDRTPYWLALAATAGLAALIPITAAASVQLTASVTARVLGAGAVVLVSALAFSASHAATRAATPDRDRNAHPYY
jgi:predicted PurR-regulated permease PerM